MRFIILVKATESSDADALRVRIGLHTGEPVREADDFYGKAVILAARIAAEARGSEILVSSLVRELTQSAGEFSFEDPTDVELKGLSGMYRLSAVRWQA
jgi:class 3 adenylate cyclase